MNRLAAALAVLAACAPCPAAAQAATPSPCCGGRACERNAQSDAEPCWGAVLASPRPVAWAPHAHECAGHWRSPGRRYRPPGSAPDPTRPRLFYPGQPNAVDVRAR